MLHYGGLNVSVITVGELLTWALRAQAPKGRLTGVQDLLKGTNVLDVTLSIAERFAQTRAGLLDRGISVGELDLLNGATALTHGLTMVTHHTRDYSDIPRADHRRLARSVTLPAFPIRECELGTSRFGERKTPLASGCPYFFFISSFNTSTVFSI
jgi:predicted nucleic acid-binding protein